MHITTIFCTENRGEFLTVKPKCHLDCHVSTRHNSTRSTCRARAFWLCRACRTARLDTLVSTRSTRRTCRVVLRHDVTSQVEFRLNRFCVSTEVQEEIGNRFPSQSVTRLRARCCSSANCIKPLKASQYHW